MVSYSSVRKRVLFLIGVCTFMAVTQIFAQSQTMCGSGQNTA